MPLWMLRGSRSRGNAPSMSCRNDHPPHRGHMDLGVGPAIRVVDRGQIHRPVRVFGHLRKGRRTIDLTMECISKRWEDGFMTMTPPVPSTPCDRANTCKGVTARTVHDKGFGRTLLAFVTPAGRRFDACVLCLRADAAERWYRALYDESFPPNPIHDWIVRVDHPGEYDAAVCMGPIDCDPRATKSPYVGIAGPFPRYDETTLLVVESGFRQLGVEWAQIPRLLRGPQRVGARPLGFHNLWRTNFAVLHAGFVCRVKQKLGIVVVEMFAKCLPKVHGSGSPAKWDRAAARVEAWLSGIVLAGASGLYPHCESHPNPPILVWSNKQVLYFLKEHISFLIQRDSPELGRAVRRMYPDWDEFVSETRLTCETLRKMGHTGKRLPTPNRYQPVLCWNARMRSTFQPAPVSHSPHLAAMKAAHSFDGGGIAFIETVPAPDRPQLKLAAAYDAWMDRLGSREIVVQSNMTERLEWYVCSECGHFKSDTKCGGCERVCYDFETQTVRCHKKRGVGRKPARTWLQTHPTATSYETTVCRGEVILCTFGTHIINVDFSAMVACARCRVKVISHDWLRTIYGYECDDCMDVVGVHACEVCKKRCPDDGFNIRAFVQGVGARDIYFCRLHARRRLKAHAHVWAYDLLMSQVVNKRMKR